MPAESFHQTKNMFVLSQWNDTRLKHTQTCSEGPNQKPYYSEQQNLQFLWLLFIMTSAIKRTHGKRPLKIRLPVLELANLGQCTNHPSIQEAVGHMMKRFLLKPLKASTIG